MKLVETWMPSRKHHANTYNNIIGGIEFNKNVYISIPLIIFEAIKVNEMVAKIAQMFVFFVIGFVFLSISVLFFLSTGDIRFGQCDCGLVFIL